LVALLLAIAKRHPQPHAVAAADCGSQQAFACAMRVVFSPVAGDRLGSRNREWRRHSFMFTAEAIQSYYDFSTIGK
jgi:hypothetical protein